MEKISKVKITPIVPSEPGFWKKVEQSIMDYNKKCGNPKYSPAVEIPDFWKNVKFTR